MPLERGVFWLLGELRLQSVLPKKDVEEVHDIFKMHCAFLYDPIVYKRSFLRRGTYSEICAGSISKPRMGCCCLNCKTRSSHKSWHSAGVLPSRRFGDDADFTSATSSLHLSISDSRRLLPTGATAARGNTAPIRTGI